MNMHARTLEQLHYDRGEERLMLAALKDAVDCVERYRHEYGARSRSTYNRCVALGTKATTAPGSFPLRSLSRA